MKTFIVLGVAGIASAIAFRCLPREMRGRLASGMKHRISERVEHIMAGLPEDFPPKLIMSVLPKLRVQNDQIIAMLQEQNELLRKQQRTSVAMTTA